MALNTTESISEAVLLPARVANGRVAVIPALLRPREVLARVEDVAQYGLALVVLIVLLTVVGGALVETGLIDERFEARMNERFAELERDQIDVTDRLLLSQQFDEVRKEAAFLRWAHSVWAVATGPLLAVTAVLMFAVTSFGAVALSGRKPEWHTLMTIAVVGGYTDLGAAVVRFAFIWVLGSLDVETSLAPLINFRDGSGAESNGGAAIAVWRGLLSGVDPFRLWYWWVVGTGLRVTRQLPGWKGVGFCAIGWLGGVGGRIGVGLAA